MGHRRMAKVKVLCRYTERKMDSNWALFFRRLCVFDFFIYWFRDRLSFINEASFPYDEHSEYTYAQRIDATD